jgi:hypothetical protein
MWMENGKFILINHTNILDEFNSNWCIVVTKLFIFLLTWVPNNMFILIKMSNPLIIIGAKWHGCLTEMSNI